MKSLFTIYLILIAFFSNSQEIECQYPPSNHFTGTCEAFYMSGKIRSQTGFVDGLRHGSHVEYYESGQIAASAKFHKHAFIGEAIRYSEEGVMIFKMVLDSNETGAFVLYANDGKQILQTGQYRNSYRDGEWKYFSENGSLLETQEHNSDSTVAGIERSRTATDIFIPAEEMIETLFIEELGLPIEIRPETIVDEPDVYAEFPEGTKKMKEFIMMNVQYPEDAREKGDQGTVYVSFIVELDGGISGVRIMRGVCSSLNLEAIRLVKSMPNWVPAIYQNKDVRSKVYLPITFTLN